VVLSPQIRKGRQTRDAPSWSTAKGQSTS